MFKGGHHAGGRNETDRKPEPAGTVARGRDGNPLRASVGNQRLQRLIGILLSQGARLLRVLTGQQMQLRTQRGGKSVTSCGVLRRIWAAFSRPVVRSPL
ncbi:hypothetical protein HA45_18030 [Pantoea rodasii]|nr:hypothetical protein HA45_18030 [Pantoea rodasii]